MELRVGEKYRLGRKIGSGSFGDIYVGVDVLSGGEVAIKLESAHTKHPQLLYEAKIYKLLQNAQAGKGIPAIRWYGVEGDYNVLVLDLLGPSLEDLFNYCRRRFGLKTVLLLADQLLQRVEYIHTKNFIHRDNQAGQLSDRPGVQGAPDPRDRLWAGQAVPRPAHDAAHCVPRGQKSDGHGALREHQHAHWHRAVPPATTSRASGLSCSTFCADRCPGRGCAPTRKSKSTKRSWRRRWSRRSRSSATGFRGSS